MLRLETAPVELLVHGLIEAVHESAVAMGIVSCNLFVSAVHYALQRGRIAQCFEHLLTSNRLMLGSADDALNPAHPQSVWQRLPVLPGVMGRIMVRSQAPETTRKFKAPTPARPSSSDIGADVIQRFVEQHRDAVVRVAALDEGRAARTIMSSPYVRIITYSVLDGWRLMVAHDRRHFEQARRVTQSPGFPKA